MSNRTRRQTAPTAPAPDAAVQQEVRAHDPHRVLIVALDIGKDVHLAYARTLAGDEVISPTKLSTLAVGLEQLCTDLDRLMATGTYDLVLLGHEPTGLYHETWLYCFLTS